MALHDVGKASLAFQSKAESLWPTSLLGPRPSIVPGPSHGEITGWYLANRPLDEVFERFTPYWDSSYRRFLVDAVAGHHGRPIPWSKGIDHTHTVGRRVTPMAKELAEDLAATIAAEPVEIGLADTDHPVLAYAWYIATLLPLSDWIASNSDWFPATPAQLSPADYWATHARPRAEAALTSSGIGRVVSSEPNAARIIPEAAQLSPIQVWANTVPLPPTPPMLAIIEDATGSGKTEAALILAHRLMHAGFASGVYMALPTMATANAMFQRLGSTYRGLFKEGSNPSLVLAHGRAGRNPHFLAARQATPFLGNGREEDVAGYCNGWIAADRRKAFLAQAGAGTIDQAVLAVLPSKYQTLRLRGLADKQVSPSFTILRFQPFGQTANFVGLSLATSWQATTSRPTFPGAAPTFGSLPMSF